MKIQAINSFSATNAKAVNNARKNQTNQNVSLPKSVNVEQNLSNPTFKNCGATQAAVLAGCSTFGIT